MAKSKSFTKTKFWQTLMLIGSISFLLCFSFFIFNKTQQQQQKIWLIVGINIYQKKSIT